MDFEVAQIALDPRQIGYWFFTALGDRAESDLRLLVTPESLPSWGSFEVAAAALEALDNPGMMQEAIYAEGDPDVCYMRIVRDATTHKITQPTLLDDPLILTLVWRPERGHWMVHRLGYPVASADVPRGT